MGKITRQSEASHVTTIVPEPGGDPEVVPQVLTETGPRGATEGQTGNENTAHEVVETDDDGNQVRRDVAGNEIKDDADDDGELDYTPVADGTTPAFEATGEADVHQGEEPPVDRSMDEVKSWVGSDYVKAERALDAERSNKNRASLVQWLEKVAATR